MPEQLAYTIEKAVEATCYSRTHIYELIREGRLPVYRVGKRVYITAENLKKIIEEDARNAATSS